MYTFLPHKTMPRRLVLRQMHKIGSGERTENVLVYPDTVAGHRKNSNIMIR
jgi:hypothetical protein